MASGRNTDSYLTAGNPSRNRRRLSLQQQVVRDVDKFLEIRDWKDATFGNVVMGDRNLVARIRSGVVSVRLIDAVYEYLRKEYREMRRLERISERESEVVIDPLSPAGIEARVSRRRPAAGSMNVADRHSADGDVRRGHRPGADRYGAVARAPVVFEIGGVVCAFPAKMLRPKCRCGRDAIMVKPGELPIRGVLGIALKPGKPSVGTCEKCWQPAAASGRPALARVR